MSIFDDNAFKMGAAMSSHKCLQDGALLLPYEDLAKKRIGWRCKRCGETWSLRVPRDMTKWGLHALDLTTAGILIVEDERPGLR